MTNPTQAANRGTEKILRSRLALHLALEASLEKSRKALLALDLAGLVIETREQILLARSVAVLDASRGSAVRIEWRPGRNDLISTQTLEQLRASALRVQSTIRLQLALLVRSHQKLRVMANMLAGTSAPYSRVAEQRLRGGLQA